MSHTQPPAGTPTPTVYEKHQYLQERHMRVLELRDVLLQQVMDSSTAHSWVMILGSSMRDLRAQSELWELVRRLPKGVTLAKQYPEYFAEAFAEASQAPAAVRQLPASRHCAPSPAAVPSPVATPSPAISSGSEAAVLVPPAPGAGRTTLRARPIRRTSASRRARESHYPPVSSRPRNKPAGWVPCASCRQRKKGCFPAEGAGPQGPCILCVKDRKKCTRVAAVAGTHTHIYRLALPLLRLAQLLLRLA
ncbi:hypothetical protein BJV77DRAFT_1025785 [Russula vinacea]|nr:hypothetical protein BJV77DRAFT_1025785 [Russula vinacea]